MQGHSEANRELLDAAALCRQLVPEGSVEAFLADHRHELFPDEMFEDLFPSRRGRPSIPADTVASVMVLQALEGLSDRDAARALTDRISWKVACGLALDDEGFDYSVLTYWRTRLRQSARPERIFEAVRSVIDATGVLKGKSRRALDSTLLDDAVATQDTVTQLVGQIRKVRRVVHAAATVAVVAHDYDAAGQAPHRLGRQSSSCRARRRPGQRRLGGAGGVYRADRRRPARRRRAPRPGRGPRRRARREGKWRIVRGVAKDRVISVVDPEARHMHKSRSEYRDGYKAHLCGRARDRAGDRGEADAGQRAGRPDRRRTLGGRSAGPPGPRRRCLRLGRDPGRAEGRAHTAIKPYPTRPRSRGLPPRRLRRRRGRRHRHVPSGPRVRSAKSRCQLRCALHDLPAADRGARTRNDGSHDQPHHHDAELRESRRAWRDGDFISDYRKWRPMVERSIAWLVKDHYRRVRFRGVERNQLGLSTRVAAINLRRLVNLGLTHDEGWSIAVT